MRGGGMADASLSNSIITPAPQSLHDEEPNGTDYQKPPQGTEGLCAAPCFLKDVRFIRPKGIVSGITEDAT